MKKHWVLFSLLITIALVVVACGGAPSEPAKTTEKQAAKPGEPYKFGLTGALTGPAAESFQPIADGMRIYFDQLNEKGGVDGHPVQLIIDDDKGDAGVATSNAKKYVESGVNGIIVVSTSNTYAPVVAEGKKANVPVMTGATSAAEAMPGKLDPLVFALHQMGPVVDAGAIIQTIAQLDKAPKIGIAAIDIPVAVINAQDAQKIAQAKGLEATIRAVPPTTVDYAPVADEFLAKGITWALGTGPAAGNMLGEAMKRRGYQGSFLFTYEDPVILEQRKDAKTFSMSFHTQSYYGNLPEHKAILSAAEKYKAATKSHYLIWGWSNGRVLESILVKTGWPINTQKMLGVMNNFEFDGRPLQAPTKWTDKDHLGWVYWTAYKWDSANSKVVPAMGWWRISSDAKTIESVGELAAPAK